MTLLGLAALDTQAKRLAARPDPKNTLRLERGDSGIDQADVPARTSQRPVLENAQPRPRTESTTLPCQRSRPFLVLYSGLLLMACLGCGGGGVSSGGGRSSGGSGGNGATPTPSPLSAFEVGGSNYPMYSVGQYLTSPTLDTWYTPGVLRPVIGTFDQAPATVQQQLQTMYTNGQRKIALDLWYADFSQDLRITDSPVYGHVVNSKLGRLFPEHASNLRQVLKLIQETGYNEIILRFDSQGISDPKMWTTWDESKYQNNWSFVTTTRATVEDVLGPGTVYDLDGELAGTDVGLAREYVVRMWRDYTSKFGSVGTFGFSFAIAPGRITKAIADFDQVGVRPVQYAVDIYGNELNTLTYVGQELADAHEDPKPIVILEDYYNDAASAAEVKQARDQLRLNIRTLLQWPLARGATQPNFSMDYPPEFGNYRAILFQQP